MPTFTTKIYLQKADKKDMQLLTVALKQKWFIEEHSNTQQKTNAIGDLSFTKRGNNLLEINDEVIRAVRETGHPFSFTVIKNKN